MWFRELKWDSAPGRWLLDMLFNFFLKPSPALDGECDDTWMEYLHRTGTFTEGVPFLSTKGGSATGDGNGNKNKSRIVARHQLAHPHV